VTQLDDPRVSNLRPLNGVSGGTSETLAAYAKEAYGGEGPSIRIESAEGITTYPGLNGDKESDAARKFINNQLAKIEQPGTTAITSTTAKREKQAPQT
jgi:hypothetical protein